MVSGAGHDAMILAEKVPAAMIFLRTPGGISHDPAETVESGGCRESDRNAACICSICLRVPTIVQKRMCTVHNLGQTRSSQQRNHLLLTPDTFVRAPLPGMKGCTAIVHAGPALGAAFTQYTAEFEAGGELGGTTAQRFLFVLDGRLRVEAEGKKTELDARGYAYLPEGFRIALLPRSRAASR